MLGLEPWMDRGTGKLATRIKLNLY